MRTSDVYLAAALLSIGYVLKHVDRKDPKHMVFEFDAGGDDKSNLGRIIKETHEHTLSEVEKQWTNRTLTVNAFDFSEAIKRMKSLIHSDIDY